MRTLTAQMAPYPLTAATASEHYFERFGGFSSAERRKSGRFSVEAGLAAAGLFPSVNH